MSEAPSRSTLEVHIEVDTNMWGDGTLALFFTMLVDGRNVDDASIDPDAFFDALLHDGRHPLLMCPTGEIDCCGSFAQTRASAEGWRVEVEHLLPETLLDWPSVAQAGSALLDAIVAAVQEHGVEPYVPSRVENILPRVPEYRSVLDSITPQ